MLELIWSSEEPQNPLSAQGGMSAATLKLYRGNLDAEPDLTLLSSDERDRAARYGDPIARRRFIVRRTLLRELLGHNVVFQYNPFGKPSTPSIEFSLSSSGNLALYLLSSACPVGVDVERIDPAFDYGGILEADSPEEFFRAWTRREALGKAAGTGLANDPGDAFMAQNLHLVEGFAIAVATLRTGSSA